MKSDDTFAAGAPMRSSAREDLLLMLLLLMLLLMLLLLLLPEKWSLPNAPTGEIDLLPRREKK